MLAKRKDMPEYLKEKYSHKVILQLIQSTEYVEADTILCYVSTTDEVSTKELIEMAWKQNKKVGVPKVLGPHKMEFFEIHDFSNLKKGYKGIMEPYTGTIINPEKALIIVPGTVFDIRGKRIGYGGGFYDTYLQKHPKFKRVAFAFSMQIADTIPTEPHDISMDFIYTEKGVYKRMTDRLPKDPVMLLSVVNTELRDNYPTLDIFCKNAGMTKEQIIKALKKIDYEYDETVNQFV